MSENLATLRKNGGGGSMTETSLWTNSAPTSSFASQQITLSDNMTNYTYIKIKIRRSTSVSTVHSVIFLVDDFTDFTNSASKMIGAIANYGTSSTTNRYARTIGYAAANIVSVSGSTRIGGTGTDDVSLIPVEIIGIK